MRHINILPATFLLSSLLVISGISQAQVYDDIYYNPGTSSESTSTETYTVPATSGTEATEGEYRVYSDDFSTEKYYDEDGNSYVVNNYYYEDDDNYSYANSLNRFYYPYYGFTYYSPCYDPWFWNPGWGVSYGWNNGYGWHGSYGYNWGWSAGWGWGYGNPYYNPYYSPWYSPYAYYGWGYSPYYNPYGYGNYWGGYNNGYWNGYANGYYDGYYNGYGNGNYYGPREAIASNTGGRDYDQGVMGTDKAAGGRDIDVFDRNDDRNSGTGMAHSGNYTIAQDRVVDQVGKTVTTDSKYNATQADKDASGTVKVVKRYTADDRTSPAERTPENRPTQQNKYAPATQQQNATKGYETQKDNYQWRNNTETPEKGNTTNDRPAYQRNDNNNSQPKYDNNRNNSQPKYDNNSNNGYKSQPKSQPKSSNSGSYRSNSGSYKSSSSGTRSSGSSSTSGSNRSSTTTKKPR